VGRAFDLQLCCDRPRRKAERRTAHQVDGLVVGLAGAARKHQLLVNQSLSVRTFD